LPNTVLRGLCAATESLVELAADSGTHQIGVRADDEIVDLIIAAESLCLGGTGSPAKGGEILDFQPALACLRTTPLKEESEHFALFHDAYKARSAIVHNGTFDESQLRSLNGESATAAEFANDLEEVVRRALKKAVVSVASGETFPPDWNHLLFRRERPV
jgi:hypothetical protein